MKAQEKGCSLRVRAERVFENDPQECMVGGGFQGTEMGHMNVWALCVFHILDLAKT